MVVDIFGRPTLIPLVMFERTPIFFFFFFFFHLVSKKSFSLLISSGWENASKEYKKEAE